MKVIHADKYTGDRVRVGVREGRATLALVRVENGYALAGICVGWHEKAAIVLQVFPTALEAANEGWRQFKCGASRRQ